MQYYRSKIVPNFVPQSGSIVLKAGIERLKVPSRRVMGIEQRNS
jgi:hypothetical protein